MALAVLVLLALLAGCGVVEEPVTTDEPTTEAATTAPVTITEKQIGETGENWRRIDLEDKTNAEIRRQLEAHAKAYVDREYRLPDGKTLFERSGEYGSRTIWLRDEQNGEETEIINANQDGHYYIAYMQEVLSERYFVYGTAVIDSDVSWDGNIFDMQRGKVLPIAYPEGVNAHFRFTRDGILYYDALAVEFETPISVYMLNLADFDAARVLAFGENLLKDVPEANEAFEVQTYYVDPGSCYLFVAEESALRVFDLQKKSFVTRIALGESFYYFHRAKVINGVLYLYGLDWGTYRIERYALEIPLP